MATSTSGLDVEEKVAKWRRLGALDIEEGLSEFGFSEEIVAQIVSLDRSEEINLQTFDWIVTTEDERAAVFALVGRRSSSVKSLNLQDWALTEHEAVALCVNLSSNTNIQKLNLAGSSVFGTEQCCSLLGSALTTNAILQVLNLNGVNMESEAVRCLMDWLQGNKSLEYLYLSRNPLLDEGIASVAEFLKTNASLKGLDICWTGLHEGEKFMSSALELNATLEELRFGGNGSSPEGLKKLLEPFSIDVSELGRSLKGSKNTTLKKFQLVRPHFSEDVASMIRTNNTLTFLGVEEFSHHFDPFKIFDALVDNETLQELDLSLCSAVDGSYPHLVHVLQSSNTGLTRIQLPATGPSQYKERLNEELRINKEYRAKLRGQSMVPTTAGRLVLCGYGLAGKTTILRTMERIEHGNPCSHPFNIVWKKLMQAFPSLRQILLGKDAYRESTSRTRGFNVVVFKKFQYLKSIWDFAGQKEYYALHDYLFPEIKNSCFLYVCSCRHPPDTQNPNGAIKNQETMRNECEFWLKFITSNSKPLQAPDGHGRQLPQVRFVLTHKDTLNSTELNISRQWAELVVRELKRVFKDVLELCETVEVINANSSRDVKHILQLTNDSLEEILGHQTEYAICEEVREVLAGRQADNPVMSVHEFYTMKGGKFNFANAPTPVREAVLAYLNNIGEIISPKDFDFIADPAWFGVHVLGSLISAFKGVEDVWQTHGSKCTDVFCHRLESWELVHDHGYVDLKDMKDLVQQSLRITHLQQTISSDKLIELMVRLELCFEKDPGNMNSSLFLPALFDDDTETAAKGRRRLEWKLHQTGDLHYFGRRLECENKAITFLTPGFFPRLQVHLRNYFHDKKWTENSGFAVDRNLICFAENGIEVLIEYSGDIDYYVDILVRSSEPYSVALKFIEEHVTKKILQFCASPQGCQGVLLVEAVIRPVCVRDLHLCVDRKDHSVLVSTLKDQLEKNKSHKHTWRNKIEDVKDTDLVLELLEGERESLRRSFTRKPEISNSIGSGSNGGVQFPTLLYPSIEDVGMLRMLDIKFNIARKMPVRLHLLCDHKDGSHKVENQPGRTIQLNWKEGGFNLQFTKLAVTVLWAGVGVCTNMAGVPLQSQLVDNWIQQLFNVPEMPDIDAETLHQLMNPGRSSVSISEQEILKALDRYWKIDPHTQALKEILNLQDGANFWKDFRLHKVVYTEARHQNRIGWVCDKHYRQGFQQRILHSAHH